MLRLGDQIDVRVVRVDASAGRVDLAPGRLMALSRHPRRYAA